MLKLIIEDDEGRKTVVPFVRDEITIGRQEGNTIRLTERNVSRRHARLMRSNGHVSIEDLGSYNGIRINGDRISGQVQIADGDLIQIGDYDLAIQSEDASSANAPTVPLEVLSPLAATRKLPDATTSPALPVLEPPQAADEDVRDAEGATVVDRSPAGAPKQQSTAVIRADQVESNRRRQVADLEPQLAPRLVILNTDLAGKEFTCNRTELKIGRTDDNDIAIDHRSLSRTHCKVVREETGEWRVIDLQSANGLMVNGETYAQATLRPGDIVELGHIKLKFVGPGDQVFIPPAPLDSTNELKLPQSNRAPVTAVLLALLVVVLGGGGYTLWKSGQVEGNKALNTSPIEKVPPIGDAEAAKRTAVAKLGEARAAALSLDWQLAEQRAKEARVDGKLTEAATAFLTVLDTERGNRNSLEQAAEALDAGNIDKAKLHLESAAATILLKERLDALEAQRAKATGAHPSLPKELMVNAEKMISEARDELKKANLSAAAGHLEPCLAFAPPYPRCFALMGSIYASMARDGVNPEAEQKATKYYQRFLELVPEDDPQAVKVRNILRRQ